MFSIDKSIGSPHWTRFELYWPKTAFVRTHESPCGSISYLLDAGGLSKVGAQTERVSNSATSGCGVVGHDWIRLDIDSTAAYNIVVKRRAATTTPKNGASRGTTVSPLGRDLSKIAERIASSGIKPLNRKEVAREVSERRGGR